MYSRQIFVLEVTVTSHTYFNYIRISISREDCQTSSDQTPSTWHSQDQSVLASGDCVSLPVKCPVLGSAAGWQLLCQDLAKVAPSSLLSSCTIATIPASA